MNWKFWEKKAENKEAQGQAVKLSGPKNIPEAVGRYLVVKLGKDPDWVWSLKAVVRQRPEANTAFDVRVFAVNQASAKNLNVKNFNSLDASPDLILFEGWYDKKTNKVDIKEKSGPQPKAA